MLPEPKTPANYFGMGEDYDLPDDPTAVREFEEKFDQWQKEHPEDPTGEKTLEHWRNKTLPEGQQLKKLSSEQRATADFIRLFIPQDKIDILKDFARYKKRRPRDIVIFWINNYAKLGM